MVTTATISTVTAVTFFDWQDLKFLGIAILVAAPAIPPLICGFQELSRRLAALPAENRRNE